MVMPAMLTVEQAAKQVGVCKSLIYSWCATGILPHHRLGKKGTRGKIMISEPDLMAVLLQARVEVKPPAEPVMPPPSSVQPFSELDSTRLSKAWLKR